MERSALTLTGFLATLPDTVAKPAFHTAAGRRVLGGGGIVPDVLVMADTLTSRERAAILELDRTGGRFVTSVFNYAVEYLRDHPDFEPEFNLGPSDLLHFQGALRDSGVELSPTAFRDAERFIRFQLEREIALRAWGEVGEFRRGSSRDLILQRALELLEDSASPAELLALAADSRRSDWLPVVGEVQVGSSDAPGTERDDPDEGSLP
jgi:carboxyl-terminal processing protease